MTIEDFNNLVIKEEGDKVIRFRDIGIAEVDAEDTRSIMKRNGVPMVACAIIPQPGANYIDIVDRAYEVMADLQKDLPDDVEAGIAFDNTVFIRNSINEVKDTIVEAFILVVLIIFLFLRNWRTTLIPVLGYPHLFGRCFFCDVSGRIYHKYSDLAGDCAGDRSGCRRCDCGDGEYLYEDRTGNVSARSRFQGVE